MSRRGGASSPPRSSGGRALTAPGSPVETLDLAALVRHHIEAENRGDLLAVMETVAPGDAAEYLVKSTGERWHTREAIRRFYGDWFAAVPDLRVDVVTVTADPFIAARWSRCASPGR